MSSNDDFIGNAISGFVIVPVAFVVLVLVIGFPFAHPVIAAIGFIVITSLVFWVYLKDRRAKLAKQAEEERAEEERRKELEEREYNDPIVGVRDMGPTIFYEHYSEFLNSLYADWNRTVVEAPDHILEREAQRMASKAAGIVKRCPEGATERVLRVW